MAAVAFHYTQSDGFVALLKQFGASLLVSTYQANKLLAVRAGGAGLSTLVRTFERPMGIAADPSRLALGTRDQIWLLRNAPDIAPRIEPAGMHDACYLPRSSHVTGDMGVHEIATALGTTDVRDGWRADKPHGGCVIDVPSGEFVTRGLSMPHSPRWHDGQLWVLESGTGQLILIIGFQHDTIHHTFIVPPESPAG
jgi:hypothetical protein